jgi:hypothetical protein
MKDPKPRQGGDGLEKAWPGFTKCQKFNHTSHKGLYYGITGLI